ncbi:MAG: c-type cytochrome [Bacteroidota bacterium]|nr:c-type cytochrome [Bacteroidota bacterium]
MKKTLLIASLVCLISLSFAFQQTQVKYENLKVLPKNTTKKEMDSIMKHFSMSLGVRCNFCHVRGNDAQHNFNFASDSSKHKLAARSMFKMMNKINKKYFKPDKDDDNANNANMANVSNRIPEVSCYSCHHGKEHPENRPPAPSGPPPGGAPSGPPTTERKS